MEMKMRTVGVLLFVILSALSANAQDALQTATDIGNKWAAAYDAGDAAALAAMFTQDGVFNPPPGTTLKGREAIEKAFAGRMKAGWTKETVNTTQAGGSGNMVWATGEYMLHGSGESAGKQTGGRFGWVFVREGDAWRIVMLTATAAPPK
jgi:uncharacterized protein (TIGR02246 family)